MINLLKFFIQEAIEDTGRFPLYPIEEIEKVAREKIGEQELDYIFVKNGMLIINGIEILKVTAPTDEELFDNALNKLY